MQKSMGVLKRSFPPPHGSQPVEYFDPGGNADKHRGDNEKSVRVRTHAHGEHVVGPDAHAYESDSDGSRDHDGITRKWASGENTGIISETKANAGITKT